MVTQRLSEGIQHKLLLKLLEFNYTIEYKKGQDNKVAAALSRKDIAVLATTSATPSWVSDIQASYTNDSHYTSILEQLAVNDQALPHYSLHVGIIRYKGRICIGNNNELKSKILSSLHSSAIGGHSGITATYHRVKRIFY
jgi:hypothetical protein